MRRIAWMAAGSEKDEFIRVYGAEVWYAARACLGMLASRLHAERAVCQVEEAAALAFLQKEEEIGCVRLACSPKRVMHVGVRLASDIGQSHNGGTRTIDAMTVAVARHAAMACW